MLWWFAQTTLIAGALAVVATLAGRWKRLGPEARHALWLVVLIKLAIPPFVAWPWSVPDAWPSRVEPVGIPAPVASPAPPAIEATATTPEISPQPLLDPPPVVGPPPSPEGVLASVEAPDESQIPTISDLRSTESEPEIRDPSPPPLAPRFEVQDRKSEISNLKSQIWNANSALLALWLVGSVAVVARRGIKVVRFHRGLAGSRSAPDWLVEEARAIGERVGVRPPPVVAMSSIGTPLLWCLGRPRLILPEALIGRLEADRWPGILAHELAHLARRDHWVVRLELLVEAIWWWNPLFWHARRRLHEEAEIACDARVVRALPERRFAYAEALIDVCEHIARSAIPSPALGVGGAGASRSLEGRLLMILRDPLPHRPTRRASLAALLLVALALPAWTLGQQQTDAPPKPDAPPSKPETPLPKPDAPSEASPRPDAPADPSKPIPAEASRPFDDSLREMTIDNIRGGFAKRRESLKSLSMRYVVARRDRPSRMIGGRNQTVGVQVADMALEFSMPPGLSYRFDVLSAQVNPEPPKPGGVPNPGEPPVRWSRQFVTQGWSGLVAFQGSWSQSGPIPFRQQSAGEHLGDDLAAALLVPSGQHAVNPDPSIDPLEPRPANVLDLAGAMALLLGPADRSPARLDVAGAEVVEGREVVRVAWVGDRDDGYRGGRLRGLLWVAPSLRFAVVRSEATQDPSQVGMAHGRRTWRKSAGDFVEVGGVWLPRKVEIRSTEAGRLPPAEHELVASFEDYRVNPELPPDTFHPKLKIEALDDQTGQFTTLPPKPSPSLVDRLAKAVRESKFGPPVVEPAPTLEERKAQAAGVQGRVLPEPKGAAQTSNASPKRSPFDLDPKPEAADVALPNRGRSPFDLDPEPGAAAPALPIPSGRTYADIVTDVDKDPMGRLMTPIPGRDFPASNAETPKRAIRTTPPDADAANFDPGIISRPSPGFDDPIPVVEPKTNDPVSGTAPTPKPAQPLPLPKPGDGPIAKPGKDDPTPDKAPADEQLLQQRIERHFRMDPEVQQLASKMKEAKDKLKDLQRTTRSQSDPAAMVIVKRLADLKEQYDRLWESKSLAFREGLEAQMGRGRDEIDLLQIRRNRKAADVKKAEAQRDLARAVVERNEALMKKGPNYVSREEVLKAEAEMKIADAEVAGKTSELEEAELLLNQAKRRFGIATPDPLVKEKAPGEIRDEAAPERDAALDGRDEVGLSQARRDGKAAEMKKAEARLEQAQRDMQRASTLKARNAIGQQEFDRITAELKVAEADVAQKKADLDEADVLLNRAKRRPGDASTYTRGSSASPGQSTTLAELRDAVELMEIQLQVKQAELRREEANASFAKKQAARIKGLVERHAVEEKLGDETAAKAEAAEGELETKKAEVLEFEVRLKQARRRAEAHEARLGREVKRVKDRLDWSEGMFKKGFVSKATYEADKAGYDELMIQLDPKYVPAPSVAVPDGPPPPAAPGEPR